MFHAATAAAAAGDKDDRPASAVELAPLPFVKPCKSDWDLELELSMLEPPDESAACEASGWGDTAECELRESYFRLRSSAPGGAPKMTSEGEAFFFGDVWALGRCDEPEEVDDMDEPVARMVTPEKHRDPKRCPVTE